MSKRKRKRGKKNEKKIEGKRGIKSRIGERSKNSQKSRKSPRESHSTSVKRRKFISESLCPSVQTLLACPKPRAKRNKSATRRYKLSEGSLFHPLLPSPSSSPPEGGYKNSPGRKPHSRLARQ